MPQPHEWPRLYKPGDLILHGHYVVEEFLGAGSAGQVYGVQQPLTAAHLAIKFTHLADRKDARKVAQSLIEGQATYRIEHDNVVKVHDIGCEPDGTVWILMERLDGNPVAELLARHGRFSPIYAIDLVMRCAWGLQAAHELGIIHRDVRPWNVVITAAGRVKVLDFSLARVARSGFVTTAGKQAKGTAQYMSPEHLRGATPNPQFDVFALGMMLWELLAGRLPIDSDKYNLCNLVTRHLEVEPESLVAAAGMPVYCEDVVRAAIARDQANRYENTWRFSQALADLRARLLADPAAAPLLLQPRWERQHPIAQDHDGYRQYRPPRSLPRDSPAPHVPSRRVVVAEAAGPPVAKRRVAVTVPMAIVGEPVPVGGILLPPSGDRAAMEIAAPTVRRRPLSRSRRAWAVIGGAAALTLAAIAALGLGVREVIADGAATAPSPGPSAAPRRPPVHRMAAPIPGK